MCPRVSITLLLPAQVSKPLITAPGISLSFLATFKLSNSRLSLILISSKTEIGNFFLFPACTQYLQQVSFPEATACLFRKILYSNFFKLPRFFTWLAFSPSGNDCSSFSLDQIYTSLKSRISCKKKVYFIISSHMIINKS